MTNEKLLKKIDQSEVDKCVTDRHLEKFVRQSVTQKTLNQNLEAKCAARTWLNKCAARTWLKKLKLHFHLENIALLSLITGALICRFLDLLGGRVSGWVVGWKILFE